MPDTVHFACFACRKGFKKRVHWAAKLDAVNTRCPECRGEMSWMGPAFRAPRKGDLAGWKKARRLRESGMTFAGNSGGGALRELVPRTLKDVELYIKEEAGASRGQRDRKRSDAGRNRKDGTAPPSVRVFGV